MHSTIYRGCATTPHTRIGSSCMRIVDVLCFIMLAGPPVHQPMSSHVATYPGLQHYAQPSRLQLIFR